MSNVTFTVGEPTYDWVQLYQAALALGVFNITDNTPQTSLTLAVGGTELIIEGIDLRADASRHLTAGSITGFVVRSGGQEVARIDSFATPPGISHLQTILTEFDQPAPNQAVIGAAIGNLLLMEPFDITGSNDRDVIGNTIVGGDTGFLNGGNDCFIVDVPQAAVTIDGGDDRDYMQVGANRSNGVILDFGAGEVTDIVNGNVLAYFTSFEDGRGSQFNDRIYASNDEDEDFFIEASMGNDWYDLGGDSFVKVSYRYFHDLTGIAGGINVNLATGTITKAGGGVDRMWNVDALQGTNFADTFRGTVWDDRFEGLDGADSFNGSTGYDEVSYRSERGPRGVFVNLSDTANNGAVTGTATVTVQAHTALDSFGNTDTLTSIERIRGTDLNDRIIGDNKDNELRGEDGLDRLYGNGGHDRLRGDGGNDFLYGGDGNDDLVGGDGNDTISGDEGDDYIDGGTGTDAITAGAGRFDYIAGSSGNDTINGEAGYDMLAFDDTEPDEDANGDGNPGGQNEHAGDTITVTLQNGVGAGSITGFFGLNPTKLTPTRIGLTQTFSNLERIRGSEGNDTFTMGTGFTNTEDANDSFGDPIRSGQGVFELVGGKGNDTFTDSAATGLLLVNYDEEKWTHPGFDDNDGYRWGDGGEPGVVVNLSAAGKNVAGFGIVQSNKARDTWNNTDSIAGIAAFRLTDAADHFYAGTAGVWVSGREGNDTFTGGVGADQFNAGSDNDTANGGNGNDNLNGDDGNDTLYGGNGRDYVGGGSGNDTLYGDSGNDRIDGDDGDDTIFGGTGRDDISGSSGNDTIYAEAGNDYAEGDDGDDDVNGGDGDDELEGRSGNDTLRGDNGTDRLYGGDDDDTLLGGLGNDRLNGDDGDDILHGDDANDTHLAGGNDEIYGGSGNDEIFGGAGQDWLLGEDGDDTIHGNAGDDFVGGNDGGDTLYGDAGEDELQGGSGDDTLQGGAGDDLLSGGDGADELFGDDGDDHLYGGDGYFSDMLEGGVGADELGGGEGDDTYVLGSEATGVDNIWEINGTDLITSTITRSLAPWGFIENLTLLGTSAIDGTGNGGNNVITGNDNTNVLTGDFGNDTLIGLGGTDTLLGGEGNDLLVGGLARDVMTGGNGDDTFDFDTAAEAGRLAQRDVITDFSQVLGNRDLIDLGTIDANTLVALDQNFNFLAPIGSAFNGVAGTLIWSQLNPAGTANDKTLIQADTNGDNVADFQIELTGLITLTSTDFFL